MTTRVLIVDDHKIVREGLRALLDSREDLEVIGEADNGRDAVQLALSLSPHLVIMDIAMPELNGVEATRQIVSQCEGTKVLALSMHSDKRFVARMLQAGASGYILKECAFEELHLAIQTLASNEVYLSPNVADVVIRDYRRLVEEIQEPGEKLTKREREVLQLLAEGKPTKEIASVLHVSRKTVETYRKQLMDKLKLHSIAELTKYAVREGLTELD